MLSQWYLIEVAAGGASTRNRADARPGPSLDMLTHLKDLSAAGVTAIKVEDAPRGSAYVRARCAELAAAMVYPATQDRAVCRHADAERPGKVLYWPARR